MSRVSHLGPTINAAFRANPHSGLTWAQSLARNAVALLASRSFVITPICLLRHKLFSFRANSRLCLSACNCVANLSDIPSLYSSTSSVVVLCSAARKIVSFGISIPNVLISLRTSWSFSILARIRALGAPCRPPHAPQSRAVAYALFSVVLP